MRLRKLPRRQPPRRWLPRPRAGFPRLWPCRRKRPSASTAAEDLPRRFSLRRIAGSRSGGSERGAPESEPGTDESVSGRGRIEPFFGPKPRLWPPEGPDDGAGGGARRSADSRFLRVTAEAPKTAGHGAQKMFSGQANGVKAARAVPERQKVALGSRRAR